jgi:hypothetical protein
MTAIYCFVLVTAFKSTVHAGNEGLSKADQKESISPVTSILYGQLPQAEISIITVNIVPAESNKLPFIGLSVISKISEQKLDSTFSQYTKSSDNFLISIRKSDILFPFHYFW